MAKRIALHQLVEKIQSGKLTPQEARDYFLVEPNAHRPFDFNTYINTDNVDVRNLEALARDADQLVRHIPAAPAARKKKAVRRRVTPRPIVAEGDSWFRLPQIFPFPNTCIDYLQQLGYSITNLAHWGDTLDQMLLAGQFWPYIDGGDDLLLFSAGGNDIIGNGGLATFLNMFDVDHAKPSDAPYYVKQGFFDNLEAVVSNLELGLIRPMAARHANKKIIMHGYDYAIPRPQGEWLGSPMQSQGLDPTFNAGLCQAIVRLMIDAYNVRLKALASKYKDLFIYLDLRGTIGKAEWYDELHGNDAAARKIAAKFAKAIDAATVTTLQKSVARVYLPSRAAA